MSSHKDYHPNGQLKEEGNHKNGEPHGKWTWWFENGQKWEEGTYKGGKLDGFNIHWYENGQKRTAMRATAPSRTCPASAP